MKAAVLVKLNQPLEIWDLELSPLDVGQVLVRVLLSGICGAQLQEIQGHKGNEKFLPHLMGHEGYGVVVDVGNGVTKVKKGDKVVMHWRPGTGIESGFPSYRYSHKTLSGGKITTLSEMSIVSENRLTAVPDDTNPELGALLGCSLSTALALIENESELKFGESVLIIGCGGVGLNLIAAARLRGAGEIVGLDVQRSKRELVIQQGANLFYSDPKEVERKFDLVIDTSGDVEVIDWAFHKLGRLGRLVLVGQPTPGNSLRLSSALEFFNGRGLKILASQGGSFSPQTDIPRYLNLFDIGHLMVNNLVTHRLDLSRVNEAFEILRSGRAGRVILSMNT